MKRHIPEIKNPLQHSGTSRFERLAAEMAFDYVQIEERHEADFLVYAEKLATVFQYYDQNNHPSGTWQSFFDTSIPSNQPHRALFIAFLRLLEALNEHANGLTKKHLDFYYRDVLKFADREAKPAQVHLFMTCAKSLKERFVEKAASLAAGTNDEGKKILFELVDEIVVNKTKLAKFFTVFNQGTDYQNQLFVKDYSTFLNGNETGENFPTFGESQLTAVKSADGYKEVIKDNLTMDHARVGFAISSPLLRLAEGTRLIHLKCEIANTGSLTLNKAQFGFRATSEEGWYTISHEQVIEMTLTSEGLEFKIELANTTPAIVNYDQEIHERDFRTAYPVLEITLNPNPENDPYLFKGLKPVTINEVKLQVEASNVRSLLVQNELSSLDPSKPFFPFGPVPSENDHFYIGHSDIFKHKLELLDVNIKWKDIAHANFSDHYAHYSESVSNTSFKVNVSMLRNKDWKPKGSYNLFAGNAKNENSFAVLGPEVDRIDEDTTIEHWNYHTDHGFIRLTLNGPNKGNFQAFGHKNYAKEVQRIGRHNAFIEDGDTPLELNQPYTPVIEQLTLNYKTIEETFSASSMDQFFHVTHYGEKEVGLNNSLDPSSFLPQYPFEGECYIGLTDVETPQSVSLLFQMDEGSGNADLSQIDSGVKWFYLAGNNWKSIDRLKISLDTTRNLQGTGIMRFDLPVEMDTNHQIMPNGYFWLRAVAPERSGGLDRIRSIHAQAVLAKEIDPDLSSEVVAPGTISKLSKGNNGITKIEQPYASFGGTNPDSQEVFYARITERLRHKDRGVMIWDYERLLLDGFPDLYKVKCLNHTNYQTEMVAGHVMMAVVPNLRKRGLRSPFQPRLSIHKRMEMYDFLRERISPFIYLRVENPIYEPIQLSFNVGFHKGRDEGFYGKKLHGQLQEFLSPWAFENELTENSDLVFGGELHKSTILKFIEDLEYVDFVNDFNMYHIYQNPDIADLFVHEDLDTEATFYSTEKPDGPCDRIKMQFFSKDTNQPTIQLDLKVRFMNGLIETSLDPNTNQPESLATKFRRQLFRAVSRRAAKGETITKNLVRILIKNIFYVDKLVSLDFYKVLPDDYVMEDVDVAVAKTSRSIMVTAEQHRIGVYRAGDYNCEGNVVIGIGFMIVEADFIIPEIKEEEYYEYQAR